MKNKILIVTSSYDRTCDYIINRYRNINFFRLNTDYFSTYKVSYDLSGFKITNSLGEEISTTSCKSIYYRKPASENLTGIIDSKYHTFSLKESHSLIDGIVESFSGPCLSKPSIMRRADNKILQIKIAQQVGFLIPKLTITNNKSEINKLEKNNTIVKPISIGSILNNNKKEYVQTNKYNPNINDDGLKYSPAYFQEYIKKDYEVRATFISKQDFTVKIISKNQVDWRKINNELKYELINIPKDIHKKCLAFMSQNSIYFGCFDFIVSDGDWYFLEMNANGQWAWLEFEVGCDISKAIVEYLNHD
ncbi:MULTISPECIES: MvdC/MvdD family ATP grasp protein [Providencia]|uniref:MvdC/MvdD family ATP grasp protein n=1 Tax=Providencia TaxID=586 RepID=UPI000D010394|nr:MULTISPECIES: hypothetical protein [Providencia]AVL75977.1 hypothetical protein CEQ08_20600 [Providencia rettgeri]QLQ63599.1 hypothetical protein H0904_14300 [Providencia rettgeri]URR23705.1 hypothetical protein L3Q80_04520 [Providencia rettgeri]